MSLSPESSLDDQLTLSADETDEAQQPSTGALESLGTIRVEVHLLQMVERASTEQPPSSHNVSEPAVRGPIPETSVKGRALSQCIGQVKQRR